MLLLLVFLVGCGRGPTFTETLYYGFEVNGVLTGYLEVKISPGGTADQAETVIETKMFTRRSALGQEFDTTVLMTCRCHPETGKASYLDSDVTQGTMKMGTTVVIEGGVARYTSKMGAEPTTLDIGPGVFLENPLYFPHVIQAFAGAEGKQERSRDFRILDTLKAEIQQVTYTLIGSQRLSLAGTEYDTLVVEKEVQEVGVKVKMWLDQKNGRFLKMNLQPGITFYLADPAVVGKIKRSDLDDIIIARVSTAIADFQSIAYMKVKATIRTMGEKVTAESLNVPGQTFSGTVEDNRIEGIFEIRHQRYDGQQAPPFPPDFGKDESLRPYLEPEDLVEADDPVLVSQAKELTKGAKDSWDALRRLSRWVGSQIGYAIPGGSARHTFDTRKGECGAHARLLTAFCRAVGIPARLVSGGMYTPLYGGSFGQHVWNEVYMGEAGWIPVDSTVQEVDYIDSGHIRLGSQTSFMPEKMEILDFKAGTVEKGKETAGLGDLEAVPWQAGKTYRYRFTLDGSPLGSDSFTVKDSYSCTTRLNLRGRSASGEWKLDSQGNPLAYRVEGRAGTVKYSIRCRFFPDRVETRVIQAGKTVEKTIPLTERVYLIDNNNLSLLAFLMAAVPREKGKVVTFKIFHPSSQQVLPVQLTVRDTQTITLSGRRHQAWLFEVSLAGTPIKMWVDHQGRLLKDEEAAGRMIIELLD